MKISTMVGYWGSGPPPDAPELFAAADRLRLDQIWTAEAYGSDAWTPLAWWGSRTSHVHLGTAISQLSARPPATLAMAAMTMDHLTGGRVIIGIGTSNPQVVEGWYGQRYPRPLERTREYVDILRAVIARERPVVYDGKHYQLPLAGGTGLAEGFARPGARHTPASFDVVGVPLRVIVDDDVERAAYLLRPTLALYIGGMGARGVNYHHEVFAR